MSISFYSVVTSLLWFNLFIIILSFLRWKLKVVLGYQLFPLFLLIFLSLAKLLFPFEPPFVIEVRSDIIFPFIQNFLKIKIATIGDTNITIAVLLIGIFSIVSIIFLVKFLVLVYRTLKNIHNTPLTKDVRLLSIFKQIQKEIPSKRECSLLVTDQYNSPCIFGIFHSVILLPSKVCYLSDLDIYYILKHEWQHHLDQDVTTKLLIKCLCCIMWWNPFIYLLKKNLDQSLELKCDVKATKDFSLQQKLLYTESLLHVLSLSVEKDPSKGTKKEPIVIPFLGEAICRSKKASGFNTIQRFDALLESNTGNAKKRNILGACLFSLFVISFCFVLQPYSLPPEKDLAPGTNIEADTGPPFITSKTSILIDNEDGTYSLFVNGEYLHDISEEIITQEPFCSLPIVLSK